MKVAVSHMNYDVGLYSLIRSLAKLKTRTGTPEGPQTAEFHSPRERAFENKFKSKAAKIRYLLVWNKSLRLLVYPLDVLMFMAYRLYVEKLSQKVLIMDRYFYDTLVDLTGPRRTVRARLLSWLIPTPNLSIYLDCNPENAFGRKQEYSIDYLKGRRLSYLKLVSNLPRMLVVSTDQDLEATQQNLASAVRERLLAH
jgi:thymidylate kinase